MPTFFSNQPKIMRPAAAQWLPQWRGYVLFFVIMLIFRSAVADWNQVPSGSMVPSILVGDRIVVDKMAYRLRVPFTLQTIAEFAPPKRGDVVTFDSPVADVLLVKRVIGVPGDTVEMRNNVLIINGEPANLVAASQPVTQADSATSSRTPDTNGFDVLLLKETLGDFSHPIALSRSMAANPNQSFKPVTIPADYFLMLGDNRDYSEDSRKIGLVHRQQIVGRAHAIAFSLDLKALKPRADRFFKPLD